MSTDPRITSAIGHWGPRFVTNGVALTDFEDVTAAIGSWDDWCRAWSARAAPHTLLALAASSYAIAIVPSNVRVSSEDIRSVPLVHAGTAICRWAQVAWDPHRFLAPYGEHFVTELVAYCRRDFPGRSLLKRVPPLPRPSK
jgi:hypothetical protein